MRKTFFPFSKQRFTSMFETPKAHTKDDPLNSSHADTYWCPSVDIRSNFKKCCTFISFKDYHLSSTVPFFQYLFPAASLAEYCRIPDIHVTLVKQSCAKIQNTSQPPRCYIPSHALQRHTHCHLNHDNLPLSASRIALRWLVAYFHYSPTQLFSVILDQLNVFSVKLSG